ncbi:hypothetical protein BV25DRAFT_1824189 [Artomyces pyxidatus]|uniref:Uncharacterized protein n=1 Tax=Artomyces pyxidatus TaxID=48021 RepID=A0ACB8T452_9AGAM|nr:hypothetical protein BV25DRAFT_1824189 [Artomyces pyxidatus]
MSLPMLVSGADCGPINPLQGLAKTFDRDRGLQQDHFGAGRAGSSREAFRSEQAAAPGLEQDAARFFSGGAQPALAGPSAFDLAALRSALPAPTRVVSPLQPQAKTPLAPWAADFLVQTPRQGQGQGLASPAHAVDAPRNQASAMHQMMPQAQPQISMYPIHQTPVFSPAGQVSHAQQQAQHVQIDQKLLDREFQFHQPQQGDPQQANQAEQQSRPAQPQDPDELARTAGLLVASVTHESNPKFKNSQFLGLMRQLRDRTVVLKGDEMVPNDGLVQQGSGAYQADLKGKGKAVYSGNLMQSQLSANVGQFTSDGTGQRIGPGFSEVQQERAVEDPNEAYFRQDNEEYIKYWNEQHRTQATASGVALEKQTHEWDHLQRDWDALEATDAGIRAVSNYQFQSGNPYLFGERSTDATHAHMMHGGQHRDPPSFESVLQLEAAVQRDPTNPRAWYELGVKQQENEREQPAIQALRRALELDPTHLPSWLALAVSHTNEGDRQGTYDAVRQWVDRNERYREAVASYRVGPGSTAASGSFDGLIGCLIAMANSDAGGTVDADIQIALAVLLNTNEVSGGHGTLSHCCRH